MKTKRLISILTAAAVLLSVIFCTSLSANAADEDLRFSDEYKTSPYYTKLMQALEDTQDKSVMERTLAVALSQEGYRNYATEGVDIERARADGLLWTGIELRMNQYETGNTEYTRWAQRYVMDQPESEQYNDFDWCAIFVSWCLYQAGYYDEDTLKKYYYCYVVDPRIFWDADSWIESFNLDQKYVYYAPNAHHKLDAMPWNTYYNVDVDPIEMPYRPGGLVFIGWNGTGDYFSHVSIVVDYDTDTHVLTYTNGNSDGQVITRRMDLDAEESFRGQAYTKNANRIMAYADYHEFTPLEKKEITAEQTQIVWDKGADTGLKIKTDSESVVVSVSEDGVVLSDNINGNMVLHEGLVQIGKSELTPLSVGTHTIKLTFDDGELDITLTVTDLANMLIGDVDGDGAVTIFDATVIQRYLADLAPLTPLQLAVADTDGDDAVTVLDATAIQQYLVDLINVLGKTS